MTPDDVPKRSNTQAGGSQNQIKESHPVDPQVLSTLEVEQFIAELRRARDDVGVARTQFDTVTDPLLIDHIVFRLGAAEKRFDYLFQMAKRLGIAVDGMNWLWCAED